MNSFSKLVAIASLTAVSSFALADDVSSDEAKRLVEAGTIQDFELVKSGILDTYPGALIEKVDLDVEDGNYTYEVEIVDGGGTEWDLDVDASSGEIVKAIQE